MNTYTNCLFLFSERSDGFSIGASDSKKEGVWIWDWSGNKVAFTNWDDGKPDNLYMSQDCLVVTEEKWDDVECFYEEFYFICETYAGKTSILLKITFTGL